MTVHEALNEMARRLAHVADEVPEGWYTLQQLADAKDVSVQSLDLQLRRACRLNVMERKQFRVAGGKNVWHYRVKES